MPAEQVGENGSHSNIEEVVDRRWRAFHKQRQKNKLYRVGNNGQYHGCAKACSSSQVNSAEVHMSLPIRYACRVHSFYGAFTVAVTFQFHTQRERRDASCCFEVECSARAGCPACTLFQWN